MFLAHTSQSQKEDRETRNRNSLICELNDSLTLHHMTGLTWFKSAGQNKNIIVRTSKSNIFLNSIEGRSCGLQRPHWEQYSNRQPER